MLFNSQIFIFVFLPITLIGYFLLAARLGPRAARIWLVGLSLVFYGWWKVEYVGLLVALAVSNFWIGRRILEARDQDLIRAKLWMITGVTLNLLGLGYFKYSVFVVDSAAALTGIDFTIGAVVLPLAISFYTFQQIAYVVDLWRGHAARYSLADYLLFVAFFPQLIAGPIVHHYELLPQFKRDSIYRFDPELFAQGLVFFVIGLVKKLLIADPVDELSSPIFAAAASSPPGFVEAWLAVLAFSIGLYFDFSAYSDMAVGLSRMIGIRLPYNFNSPYQARSIIDFWRRWHMTLSRFLRDYLYIPLGGNRLGAARRSVNLMLTMLLGGLWHGAAWTFVVWGALHGSYLLINHAWSRALEQGRIPRPLRFGPTTGWALTLLAVAVAWTFFAAPSFGAAWAVLQGLFGLGGWIDESAASRILGGLLLASPDVWASKGAAELVTLLKPAVTLAMGLAIALWLPNSQAFVDDPHLCHGVGSGLARLRFSPSLVGATVTAAGFVAAVLLMADVKEFVYFQF
ncbi:MAG: MBOAT family O-acyltransferase [Thiotrichales bacterium]